MENRLSVIIPELRHVKPAGRDGRPRRRAVAVQEDLRDGLRRELSFGGIDAGARHGAGHIIKKAVGADAQRNEIAVALDLVIINRAHGGFDIRADRADGGEVVRADEAVRRALHDRLVQMLGVEPCTVDIKRVADAGIIDQVSIMAIMGIIDYD